MKGTFKSSTPTSIVLEHDDGTDDTTHTLASGCKVTLDGAKAKLGDLRPGDEVEISGDGSTVKATRA